MPEQLTYGQILLFPPYFCLIYSKTDILQIYRYVDLILGHRKLSDKQLFENHETSHSDPCSLGFPA